MDDSSSVEITAKRRSKIYVISIQIIFGVIIGASFIEYNLELVPISSDFESSFILVAYSTVFASLIGYSIVIKAQFHKNLFRFVIDIILMYLYFQLIYSPQINFGYFLAMHAWIYGLYVLWQFLEYTEWGGSLKKKLSYGFPFFGAFLGIWIYYTYYSSSTMQKISLEMSRLDYELVGNLEWGILLGIFLLTIGYRYTSYKIKTNSS